LLLSGYPTSDITVGVKLTKHFCTNLYVHLFIQNIKKKSYTF